MNKILIGLCAPKRSGKTTISEYLKKNYSFKNISFAAPLKKLCMDYFDLTEEELYGNKKEEKNPEWSVTPRQILQFVGTDMFRDKLGELIPDSKNFWIKKFQKLYENETNDRIVVDDVRMQNEIDCIRKLGGLLIKIKRPNIERKDEHISEKELPDELFDIVIINDGPICKLYKVTDEIIKNLHE